MIYRLNITKNADELLDHLVYYLIYCLKNKQAARHLLDGIDMIYDNLIELKQKKGDYKKIQDWV